MEHLHDTERRVRFKQWEGQLLFGFYGDGTVALQIYNDTEREPIATVTVCVPGVEVPEGHVLIKDWSENEGMLADMENQGIVQDTGQRIPTGYVEAALCKLLIGIKEPKCEKQLFDYVFPCGAGYWSVPGTKNAKMLYGKERLCVFDTEGGVDVPIFPDEQEEVKAHCFLPHFVDSFERELEHREHPCLGEGEGRECVKAVSGDGSEKPRYVVMCLAEKREVKKGGKDGKAKLSF